MRLVLDTLFLETLQFQIPHVIATRCRIAPSREDELRQLMELVGIELIDYGSFTVQPCMPPARRDRLESWDAVNAYSRAYRERAERAAAPRL
jgi:hypothetical protein